MEKKSKREKLFNFYRDKMLVYGLRHGYVRPYNDEEINKFREVYYGALPASVILLSDALTNGFCYDRSTLIAYALLEDDVRIVYCDVNSLRVKLPIKSQSNLKCDHSVVERIDKEGNHLIYDPGLGFVFDKKFYCKLENPNVRSINTKEKIQKFLKEDGWKDFPVEDQRLVAHQVLPIIESRYGSPNEMYSMAGYQLLQREVEIFKNKIDYDSFEKDLNTRIRGKNNSNR